MNVGKVDSRVKEECYPVYDRKNKAMSTGKNINVIQILNFNNPG
jgi:hypothetical protein